MAKLQIQTNEFLDWKFADREDLERLGQLQLNHLKYPNKHPEITLSWIYNDTGYIPTRLIATCSELIECEWTPSETDEVEWL